MSKYIFNDNQIAIIEKLDLNLGIEEAEKLFTSDDHSWEELETLLKVANALYRSGYPIIEDEKYDEYLNYFKTHDPDNPYLLNVEPEVLIDSKTVRLPKKMLSTDKAYSFEEIKKWTERITKAASEIDFDQNLIRIRVTPKLDGYAAYDDGITLYTRGDGTRGQDITRAFERGLKVAENAGRGLGPGEIVIKKSYFDEVLSEKFENSRNIQAAIIAEKKVDEDVQKAIDEGACVFYPFSLLENWTGSIEELLSNFESILEDIWNSVDFDVDGLILESTNEPIKEHMGSTRKFHRWQIAFKVNDATAEVEVLEVVPQTSRTGRVSPVAVLVPTKLSGATLSRATVHHYSMVKTKGVGPGAIIKLVRSGLVIPKIEEVIKRAEPELPKNCPSCGATLFGKVII